MFVFVFYLMYEAHTLKILVLLKQTLAPSLVVEIARMPRSMSLMNMISQPQKQNINRYSVIDNDGQGHQKHPKTYKI